MFRGAVDGRDEATERITFEADTTYLGQDFQLASVVSFIQANEQTKILSKQNAYSILERTFPDVISSFQDNEEQKLSDEDAGFSSVASMGNPLFNLSRQQEDGASEGQEETEDDDSDSKDGSDRRRKTT